MSFVIFVRVSFYTGLTSTGVILYQSVADSIDMQIKDMVMIRTDNSFSIINKLRVSKSSTCTFVEVGAQVKKINSIKQRFVAKNVCLSRPYV